MNNTGFIRQTPVSPLSHRDTGSRGKWVSSRSISALQPRYTGVSFGLPNNRYLPVYCQPKVVVEQSNQRANDQLPPQTIMDQLDEIVSQINMLNDPSIQITEDDQVLYIRKITDMFRSMTNGLDKYLPKAP